MRDDCTSPTATVVQRCTPQLPEPLLTAAGSPAEPVALRMRAIAVLMTGLGPVKHPQGSDPGDDTCGETLRGCQGLFRGLGQVLLGLVVVKDRGAILRPCGTELPVWYGRIDVVPEDVQQLTIRQSTWIVAHLHGQRVARTAGSNVLVGGISLTAPGIAHDCGDDTMQCVERRLQTPEAATGKGRRGALVYATAYTWCREGDRSAV